MSKPSYCAGRQVKPYLHRAGDHAVRLVKAVFHGGIHGFLKLLETLGNEKGRPEATAC